MEVQISDNTGDCTFALAGRVGTVIASTQSDVGPTWLPSGSYTLTVTDGAPGPYAFKVWAVPNPQSFAISVNASVSNGVPAVGAGNLESPGAQDRYAFTAAPGGCSCLWSLQSAGGSYQYGFAQQSMNDVGPTLMAAGPYVLTVSGSGVNTGTYSFTLSAVGAAQSFPISVGASVSNGVPST